jgi:LuxR family maltose regulon positive regulatory protein
MIFYAEVPGLTHCKALIAKGSAELLREADARLAEFEEACTGRHNVCQLVTVLALRALSQWKQDRPRRAMQALRDAVSQAEPGGFVFPFVELGGSMAEMLGNLVGEGNEPSSFARTLLEALNRSVFVHGREDRPRPPSSLVDPLTPREIEVLELLGRGLFQREVGAELDISPETVKSHVKHIYMKLGASHRRQALEEAYALNLIRRGF